MSRSLLAGILLLVTFGGRAQSFDEWFRQDKTQLDYLRQQIDALSAYDAVMEEGYAIMQAGTDGIGSVKREDYTLHNAFFRSLDSVRPVVAGYSAIRSMIGLQERTIGLSAETRQEVAALSDWSAIISRYFDGLLSDNAADLVSLGQIVNDEWLQLKDADRLKMIDWLYWRTQQRYQSGVRIKNAVAFLRKNSIP